MKMTLNSRGGYRHWLIGVWLDAFNVHSVRDSSVIPILLWYERDCPCKLYKEPYNKSLCVLWKVKESPKWIQLYPQNNKCQHAGGVRGKVSHSLGINSYFQRWSQEISGLLLDERLKMHINYENRLIINRFWDISLWINWQNSLHHHVKRQTVSTGIKSRIILNRSRYFNACMCYFHP